MNAAKKVDGFDEHAYALVPASVLLEMKQYMQTAQQHMKHGALQIGLKERIKGLLADAKEHMATVEYIDTEIEAALAQHFEITAYIKGDQLTGRCGVFDGSFEPLADKLKRAARHAALKVLGEKVNRDDAAATSKLERITSQLEQAVKGIEGGGLVLDVNDDPAVFGLKKKYADLYMEMQEMSQLTRPISLTAEVHMATMVEQLNGMCTDIDKDGTLAAGVIYDIPVLNTVRSRFQNLIGRANETQTAFGYGSPENRQEIGVFLSHVLPRVSNPNFTGDPDLIDDILDAIALVGTRGIDANIAARNIGEAPLSEEQLAAITFDKRVAGIRETFPPNWRSRDAEGMKHRLINVKNLIGINTAKEIIQFIGDARDLGSIRSENVDAVCMVCEWLIAAFDPSRVTEESVATQEPYFGSEKFKQQMRPDVLQNAWFADVLRFNLAAGRTMDEFNPRMIGLHTGLQLEELAEKLRAVVHGLTGTDATPFDGFPLVSLVTQMEMIGNWFKGGTYDNAINHADPVELADGDIDQMVVSFGSLHSQGVALFSIMHAVSDANLRKMVDGKLILDPVTKKIQKPDGWKPADLLPHLHPTKQPHSLFEAPAVDTCRAEDDRG